MCLWLGLGGVMDGPAGGASDHESNLRGEISLRTLHLFHMELLGRFWRLMEDSFKFRRSSESSVPQRRAQSALWATVALIYKPSGLGLKLKLLI